MTLRFFAMAACAMLLTACVAQPVRQALPPISGAPEANQATREARLASARDWNLQGRVALSNGRSGGSGRIDWQQVGDHYEVALSAPVTRQSWRLDGNCAAARLEGLDGGPREGADAAQLLCEATGWEIPAPCLPTRHRQSNGPWPGPARH